jgi:hypothetical protein
MSDSMLLQHERLRPGKTMAAQIMMSDRFPSEAATFVERKAADAFA